MISLSNFENAAEAILQSMEFHHNLNIARHGANAMSQAAAKLNAVYKQSPLTLHRCFPTGPDRERLYEILEMSDVLTKLATSLTVDFHDSIAGGVQRGMTVAQGELKQALMEGGNNA